MNRTLSFIFLALSLTLFAFCMLCNCDCSERHGCRTVTVTKNDGSQVSRRFCSDQFGSSAVNIDAPRMDDSIDAFIAQHGPFANAFDVEDSVYFEKGVLGLNCDETDAFERKGYKCRCGK